MPAFLFRCPATGLRVQAWTAEDLGKFGESTFDPVTCAACGSVHLVNPATGKTVADTARPSSPATKKR